MDDALQILDAVEKTSSRNEKEALLAGIEPAGLEMLKWALDPYRTYGIQNIPEYKGNEQCNLSGGRNSLLELGELLRLLHTREVVGNEARALTEEFLKEMYPLAAKWYRRIILKDLKCGITSKTVNKVFPNLVPEFNVALAEDSKGKLDSIRLPVWCDYKLDGLRMVTLKDGNNVSFFTRKGHLIETLPTLAAVMEGVEGSFVLDGEVMGRSWNESQSTVFATKNTVDDAAMFYNVFDGMLLTEWTAQKCETPYMQRRQFACEVVSAISNTRVRTVGGKLLSSVAAIKEFYQAALNAGHEGIMLKDPEAPYYFKRSKAVQKMKPSSTWEGVIVGWATGDMNSKWRGAFGAFQVEFKKGKPTTSVGGGFTDEMRWEFTRELQKNPEAYNGKIVEVKGQEMTRDGLVRFPVFVRFRDERDK